MKPTLSRSRLAVLIRSIIPSPAQRFEKKSKLVVSDEAPDVKSRVNLSDSSDLDTEIGNERHWSIQSILIKQSIDQALRLESKQP